MGNNGEEFSPNGPYELRMEPAPVLNMICPFYERDFPVYERKSVELLQLLLQQEQYQLLTVRRPEDEAIAAYLMGYTVGEGRFFWLDYYAVLPSFRNQCIGAWAIRRLFDVLSVSGLFLEVEYPESEDPEVLRQQRRRIGFYERLGAVPLRISYRLLQPAGGIFPIGLYYLAKESGGPPEKETIAEAVTTTYRYTYGYRPENYAHWEKELEHILKSLSLIG